MDGDPIDERLRAAFFIFTLVGAHSSTQRDGIVLIHNNINVKLVSLQFCQVMLEILNRATPMRVSKCIILRSHAEQPGSMGDEFNTRLCQIYAKLFGASVPHLVSVRPGATGAQELQERFAIPESCVPIDMGGLWTYDKLMEWRSTLISTDADPPASLTLLATARASPIAENSERAEELSKARNALYARRAYRRKKAKEVEIEQELRRLEAERAVLESENQRLESLYQNALSVVGYFKSSFGEQTGR